MWSTFVVPHVPLAYSDGMSRALSSSARLPSRRATRMSEFRNLLGMFLQLMALTFLPVLILWQLNFGFNLLWMPGLTLIGVGVFLIGHKLRDRVP